MSSLKDKTVKGVIWSSIDRFSAPGIQVTAVDVVPEKVEMINCRQSPIQDEFIEKMFC
jgi:UDPglucose 6-dehydrogenase